MEDKNLGRVWDIICVELDFHAVVAVNHSLAMEVTDAIRGMLHKAQTPSLCLSEGLCQMHIVCNGDWPSHAIISNGIVTDAA